MVSLSKYLVYCAVVGVLPEWHKTIFRRQMKSSSIAGLGHVRQFSKAQLDEKYEKIRAGNEEAAGTSEDFITKFLRIQSQDPSKINSTDISSVCMMNIGAGSDTTSISLTSTILNLVKNPRVLQRLREEIKDCEAHGVISNPIKFSEAKEMPYLQAVLKEALRMHPATGLSLGRIVPPEGANLAGQYFPPKVRHSHTAQ
jgi:cytochrome P450